MSPYSYRLWHPPVVHRIADITGWLVDMTDARVYLGKLLTLLADSTSDTEIAEALATAAIVKYSRCFTSGSRGRLALRDLRSADEEDIECHEWLRGVRDWHIAHPINEQEVHALHLMVDESPDAPSLIVGASGFMGATRQMDASEAHRALKLCEAWIGELSKQLVAEQLRLKPYALMLSRDQVLSLPIEEPEPNDNIRSRRRQFHNK